MSFILRPWTNRAPLRNPSKVSTNVHYPLVYVVYTFRPRSLPIAPPQCVKVYWFRGHLSLVLERVVCLPGSVSTP